MTTRRGARFDAGHDGGRREPRLVGEGDDDRVGVAERRNTRNDAAWPSGHSSTRTACAPARSTTPRIASARAPSVTTSSSSAGAATIARRTCLEQRPAVELGQLLGAAETEAFARSEDQTADPGHSDADATARTCPAARHQT
jgi:hypothetical protein